MTHHLHDDEDPQETLFHAAILGDQIILLSQLLDTFFHVHMRRVLSYLKWTKIGIKIAVGKGDDNDDLDDRASAAHTKG